MAAPETLEIEVEAVVDPEHRTTVQLPAAVKPGPHHLRILIDVPVAEVNGTRRTLDLPAWAWNNWPADCLFTRDDLYWDEDDD